MASWKSLQESIKDTMRELEELYKAQHNEKKALQTQYQSALQESQEEFRSTLQRLKQENESLRAELAECQLQIKRQTLQIVDLENSLNERESLEETQEMQFGDPNFRSHTELNSLINDAELAVRQKRLRDEARRIQETQELRRLEQERALKEKEDADRLAANKAKAERL